MARHYFPVLHEGGRIVEHRVVVRVHVDVAADHCRVSNAAGDLLDGGAVVVDELPVLEQVHGRVPHGGHFRENDQVGLQRFGAADAGGDYIAVPGDVRYGRVYLGHCDLHIRSLPRMRVQDSTRPIFINSYFCLKSLSFSRKICHRERSDLQFDAENSIIYGTFPEKKPWASWCRLLRRYAPRNDVFGQPLFLLTAPD